MTDEYDPEPRVFEVGVDGAAKILMEQEGGEQAAYLMVRLMLSNAEHRAATFEGLYEIEQIDHERTRERLRAAYERLNKIDQRLYWLLGLTDDIEPQLYS